jgi:hypothetical protein
MKIAVITANIGGSSNNTICKQTVKCDIYKLDNSNFHSRKNAMHPRLVGKIPKMLGWELYPDYDYYIWIDNSFSIRKETSIEWLINQLGNTEIALFKHPNRSSIKEEFDFMHYQMVRGDQYLIQRYSGEPMEEQISKYYQNESFIDNKLFACGCFVYSQKLVESSQNLMKDWFYHNCIWSVQDQLSLPYLLQKYKTNYNTIEKNIFETLQNL